MSSLCDRRFGCWEGKVIHDLGSASTCWRELEYFLPGCHPSLIYQPWNPQLVFFSSLFFFSSSKCFIIIFVSFGVDTLSLSLMTFGFSLQPFFLSLFFMVPRCCEQNSFFKRQMVATVFSLNKKAKQLLRCKQSCGQKIVSASSVGEVSL